MKQTIVGLQIAIFGVVLLAGTLSVQASHIVNGAFDSGEWDGVSYQTGIYSRFYFAWDANDVYIMNDWWNTESNFQLDPNGQQWNTFTFEDSQGDDWEFRVYADDTVTVWENTVERTDSGIVAAYGFGPSLLDSNDHTLYEVMIPGTLFSSGGVGFQPMICDIDPRFFTDVGDGGWQDGPFYTPEPGTLSILILGGLAVVRRWRGIKTS